MSNLTPEQLDRALTLRPWMDVPLVPTPGRWDFAATVGLGFVQGFAPDGVVWFTARAGATYALDFYLDSNTVDIAGMVTLYDAQGRSILSAAASPADNLTHAIPAFVAPVAGLYYAGVQWQRPGPANPGSTNAFVSFQVLEDIDTIPGIDRTPPVILGLTPADKAAGIALDAGFTIRFSEPVLRGQGTVQLKLATGQLVESIDVATSTGLRFEGSTAVLSFKSLQAGQKYVFDIPEKAFVDGAGFSTGRIDGYSFSTRLNEIRGQDLPENLRGTSRGDAIYGLGGNDVIEGAGGDDVIDGGAGRDSAVYAKHFMHFSVQKAGNEWLVKDEILPDSQEVIYYGGLAEGNDRLIGIEEIRFGNDRFDLVVAPRGTPPQFGTSDHFLFDPVFYRLDNAEATRQIASNDAWQHYFATGAAQGLVPNSWFDAAYYQNRWADLKGLTLSQADLFRHYNLYGVWEGRSASARFDTFDNAGYLRANPDVAGYVDDHLGDFLGSTSNGALAHFIIYGAAEGRIATDTSGQAISMDYLIVL